MKRFWFFTLLVVFCMSLSSAVKGQNLEQRGLQGYHQGIDLFDRGLYPQSADELQRFIAAHPEHELLSSARFYHVRALAQADSVNRDRYYEQFIADHPRTGFTRKLLLELADNAAADSLHSEAIEYYRRTFNHGPGPREAAQTWYWMAESAAAMEDYEQARSLYLTLADTYEDSEWAPPALYARGRLFLTENMYDSSSAAFELLRERYPNHEITRRIGTALGESYYQQGRYSEAITAFKEAMPHVDEEMRTKAVFLIAESYNYLNNYDEASTYYLQYINRTKGTDEERRAHYGLGWVYHKQEIYHWAADSFERAATGDDEMARKALYYKAVNEKLGGRYGQAIETFQTFGDRYEEGLWVEEAYYEWAVTAFEMGDFSQAIEVLLPLVRSEENLEWAGKVYTLLGQAYFSNKEYTRSLQAFEAAEQSTEVDPEIKRQARFQRAWVQYRNQAYEQAQEGFENVHRDAPDSETGREALFWSADAYYQMEDYGPASSRFADFIRSNPDHELTGAARYALGWSHFKMGNYDRAVEPLQAFLNEYDPPSIALYPYDTDTRLRIGDAYYALGRYEEAIASYEEAIGAEPGGDYAMFQIGNSHYRNDRTYDAVTTFRRFLRIYPYSRLREQAQYNIAYIYLNTGNYSQSVEEFQTVINKYPGTTWAARSQYNIGDAYYNAGDYDEAIAAYEKVMEEYPRSDYIIEAVNGIQYAQLSAGRTDSSSAVLEEFLADNPSSGMADQLRYRQAENLMQSGNYQQAIEELQQYIRITNNQELLPDAHFNLANAWEESGNMEQALETYRTVVEQFSNSDQAAPALARLGRLSYDRQEYQESFNHFSRLLEQSQGYRQEALIGMGNAQLAMHNLDEAQSHFEAAGEVDPARIGMGKIALEREAYDEAADLFNLVAESNTTEIGAEAQYHVGLTHQARGDDRAAVEAFSNLRVLYEAYSTWVARSLLKSAESYIRLGESSEARGLLNRIVDEFPGTPEARRAQQMLESD